MKHAITIILCSCILWPAVAQWDTASAPARDGLVSPSTRAQAVPWTGMVLTGAGNVFALRPEWHQYSVQLRDAVQADNHPKCHIDDYLQFAPLATPFVLNLCGVEGRNNFKKMTLLAASGQVLGFSVLEGLKYGVAKERPDTHGRTSFPSGHTYFTFSGAELLRREYGRDYPWVAVAGYAVASFVGAMRVYNNRHWISDVAAGAGIGILSVSTVYWIDELWQNHRRIK